VTRAAAQFDERIRFFRSRRENATRAVIFKRARDKLHVIRKEGRCERISSETLEGLAVELK
jgi:hypothetical protein